LASVAGIIGRYAKAVQSEAVGYMAMSNEEYIKRANESARLTLQDKECRRVEELAS